MLATTVALAASMTDRSPPVSFVTYTPTAGMGAGAAAGTAVVEAPEAGGAAWFRPHAIAPQSKAKTKSRLFMLGLRSEGRSDRDQQWTDIRAAASYARDR